MSGMPRYCQTAAPAAKFLVKAYAFGGSEACGEGNPRGRATAFVASTEGGGRTCALTAPFVRVDRRPLYAVLS